MRYIYFYLYRFLSCAPRKGDASGWAATFASLFFVANGMALYFTIELLTGARTEVPHGKVIVAVITLCATLASYGYYEIAAKGKGVISSLDGTSVDRHSAVIGGILFFECLLCGAFPGVIAVIRNPTPWIK